MKYLKEGKWDDFKNDVDAKLKSIEDTKIEYNYYVKKLNNDLIEEIAQCMVDLEDYLIDYSTDMGTVFADRYLCIYEYMIPNDGVERLNDLIAKLDEHIGKDSYSVEYYRDGNSFYYKNRRNVRYFPATIEFNFYTVNYKEIN